MLLLTDDIPNLRR